MIGSNRHLMSGRVWALTNKPPIPFVVIAPVALLQTPSAYLNQNGLQHVI